MQNLTGRTSAPLRLQQQDLPIDTKILEKVALTTTGRDGGSNKEHILLTLGIPHTEHEFFLWSVCTQHPLEKRAECSDRIKTQVFKILTQGVEVWKVFLNKCSVSEKRRAMTS